MVEHSTHKAAVVSSILTLDTMNPIDPILVGSLGALFLLVAFSLQKLGFISEKCSQYDFLNVTGAGLLTWYAALLNSLPFIILEGIWAIVAGWYLFRRLLK